MPEFPFLLAPKLPAAHRDTAPNVLFAVLAAFVAAMALALLFAE